LRRFDQLLNFRAPNVHERAALWRAHLPENHVVSERCAADVAEACTLTGGQIRNVALSAASAALASSRRLDDTLLIEALRREYRRAGSLCPVGGH
jgi:SpoVK/Ycf46/Vps4 family AAA+-type ATPase